VLAELLLERYGIVTREQVLAEGIGGGFAMLYDTFANLETLGVCRRGYFIEGMGGAQFALPGAVERLRAGRGVPASGKSAGAGAGAAGGFGGGRRARTLVLAAADPAQPYGGVLAWPKREERIGSRPSRPARVAGAYVVLVEDAPALYLERGGRGLVTLSTDAEAVAQALVALADAVRAGRVGRLALERIDGEPAIGSRWETRLADLGFRTAPRRLTLSA
jgi:ATP-dependent Lhr-like helicase